MLASVGGESSAHHLICHVQVHDPTVDATGDGVGRRVEGSSSCRYLAQPDDACVLEFVFGRSASGLEEEVG